MPTLNDFLARWGLPPAALADLVECLEGPVAIGGPTTGPEALAQQLCRLEAQKVGARLWRNNVGAGKLENGQYVRWGICNESHAQNLRLKSSDLIGIRPLTITEAHVGQVVGQFIAREIKAPGWQRGRHEREDAQERFLSIVNALGGDGKFSTGGF